jgi:hypothetical protein
MNGLMMNYQKRIKNGGQHMGDQNILVHSPNKLFETTSEKLPILFLEHREKRDIGIFSLDRVDFPKELKEKTEKMIKELVKLFFEEFYSRSLYWRKSNETWMHKPRKWGKDYEECARLYLEGRTPTLQLPPVTIRTKVFLAVGTFTVFKMEKELIREFIREALPVINRYACEFGFVVVWNSKEGSKCLLN